MEAEGEGVVRAVMVGGSAMEAAVAVTVVVVVGPGKVERDRHVVMQRCRSAAVWEVGEPGGWGEIFRQEEEDKKKWRHVDEGKKEGRMGEKREKKVNSSLGYLHESAAYLKQRWRTGLLPWGNNMILQKAE